VSFAGAAGPTGFGTNYFAPFAAFALGPASIFESDIYLVAAAYKDAREAIYDLRNTISSPDIFAPFGSVDAPQANSQVRGTIEVAGWAFDNVAVSKVEILVDDFLAGTATYGTPRPDVQTVWHSAAVNCGFQFQLDTTLCANGPHTLTAKATDSSGNVAAFSKVRMDVNN